jgi:hypothetical protein
MSLLSSKQFLAACLILFTSSLWAKPNAAAHVDFNRDIRPILSENCFYCHGADSAKRKAKLRLDVAEGPLQNGVLVPGNPEASELVKRILSTDAEEQMPPPDSNRHLSKEQKQLLQAWIKDGAKYDTHWAFKTPLRPALPSVKKAGWSRNEIDRFVLARLEEKNLKPMPEAPLPKLLRRLALDLTGLPPSTDQMKRWQAKKDPFTTALEELLASPRFGERMTADWMDIARYADTHGFNNDSLRSMWRWRDWSIDAFNRNLAYDQFITEQLAGDLLPKPTTDRLIATGFNRNHVINSEGGIIDEEYRVEYVADRVRTTSMAWLGLTMECARCHDHKFDPITQKDYFRMFGFFNSVSEQGEAGRLANAAPFISAPTATQQAEIEKQRHAMQDADREMRSLLAKQDWKNVSLESQTNPVLSLTVPVAERMVELDPATFASTTISNLAGGKPFQARGFVSPTNGPLNKEALLFNGESSLKTAALPKGDGKWALAVWCRRDKAAEGPLLSTMNFGFPESSQQYGQGIEIRFTARGSVEVRTARRWPGYSAHVVTKEQVHIGEWHHVLVSCDGSEKAKGLRVFIDGEECDRDVLQDDFATCGLSGDALIGASDEKGSAKFNGALADVRAWAKWTDMEKTAGEVRQQVVRLAMEQSKKDQSLVTSAAMILKKNWLANHDRHFAELEVRWREARGQALHLQREAPTTMVMKDLSTPRATHVLFRGQYDQPRDIVEPDVPGFLPPLPKGAPRNRLGLALWFTDPSNPLTARVVVNRFWQNIFGTGIVKTSENFGFQSEYPSHPELLDWLARDFVDNGWDVKRLLRLIVSSATYRQDSRSTPELNELDPENRLLAHGPRFRLPAEMLRDQVLSLSGLLREQVGGPPVYPYQPTNLYQGIVVAASYPGTTYTEGKGDELYRRSLYTFWKRTVPHPTLATFDAPDREVCVARRLKTNTPLQALASMNDTVQLEAARKLAERMLSEGGKSAKEQLRYAFQLATARKPNSTEAKALESYLKSRLDFYAGDKEAAKNFLSIGTSPRNEKLDPSKLAAYANVASLILNLDETITRN